MFEGQAVRCGFFSAEIYNIYIYITRRILHELREMQRLYN